MKTKTTATFTHVGGRARVGYQQCGKLWNHYEPRAGRTHALNRTGYRQFTAVCGVGVHEDSSDSFDQGGTNPVEVAVGSARRVTCKACLRRNPVAVERPTRVRFAVVYEQAGRTDCYCRCDTRAQAERTAGAILANGLTFGGRVDAARVEEVTEYVG